MIDSLARLLNGLLMLAMPLALLLLLRRRFGTGWGVAGAGAVAFLGSQALHLPFNGLVLGPRLQAMGFGAPGLSGSLVASALLLGLSAGVFEESARFLVLRFWQRSARSWREALLFGAGHGGMEAFLLGLLALLAFFQALAYREGGLGPGLSAEQRTAAAAQLSAYWSAPWPLALLGAVERAFSLMVHLALSALVMRGVQTSKLGWVAAAVGWHTVVNAAAVTAAISLSPIAAEGLVGLAAVASLGMVLGLREREGVTSPPAPRGRLEAATARDLTAERVEDSRYTEGPALR